MKETAALRLRWASAVAALLALAAPRTALAGPPFITDDPEPVDPGHWEVYAFSFGAFDSGSATGVGPSVEVNYGAAPNLQLHFIGNLAYDAPDRQPRQYGLGDVELGAKYRLLNPGKDDWYPQVGVFPLVELPTGDAKRGLGGGYVAAFLPVWVQKDFGDWTTYGGGGYWINPGPGNRNYWFAGWLLQRQVTKNSPWAPRSSTKPPAWPAGRRRAASTSAANTTSPITITCCSRPDAAASPTRSTPAR